MDGVGTILTGLAPIVIAIGGGFGWLIKEIVKSSKEAVIELRKANEVAIAKLESERGKAEADADTWRDRAYKAGWKEDV